MIPTKHPVHDRRSTDKGLGGKVLSIEDRLDKSAARMCVMEQSLQANTEATKEVLEIVSMGKSFFKFAGLIGNGLKWLVGVATVLAAASLHKGVMRYGGYDETRA